MTQTAKIEPLPHPIARAIQHPQYLPDRQNLPGKALRSNLVKVGQTKKTGLFGFDPKGQDKYQFSLSKVPLTATLAPGGFPSFRMRPDMVLKLQNRFMHFRILRRAK